MVIEAAEADADLVASEQEEGQSSCAQDNKCEWPGGGGRSNSSLRNERRDNTVARYWHSIDRNKTRDHLIREIENNNIECEQFAPNIKDNAGKLAAKKARTLERGSGGHHSEKQVEARELEATTIEELKKRVAAGECCQQEKLSATSRGRGLLEALLGERGKSWLEQKTVILDIQNGRKSEATAAAAAAAAAVAVKKRGVRENDEIEGSESKGNNIVRSTCEGAEAKAEANIDIDIEIDNKDKNENISQSNETNFKLKRKSPIILAANNPIGVNRIDLRVPTFGTVPQRLSSQQIPYFSYQGNAKNVQINTPNDRQQINIKQQQQQQITSTSNSSSTSSVEHSSGQVQINKSTNSSTSCSTARPNVRSSNNKILLRGYSNISNLFVKKSTNNRAEEKKLIVTKGKSISQERVNLDENNINNNSKKMNRRRNSFAHLASPTTQLPVGQQQQHQHQQLGQRQYSGSLLQPRTRSSQSINYQQQQPYGSTLNRTRQQQQPQNQYGGGGGSALGRTVAQQRAASTLPSRRPVSSAGNYPIAPPSSARKVSPQFTHLRTQTRNSYRLPAAPSPLIDPDCPVHGDEQHQHLQQHRPLSLNRARQSYTPNAGLMTTSSSSRQHLVQPAYASSRRPLEGAVSQPELLYESGRGGGGDYDHDNDNEDYDVGGEEMEGNNNMQYHEDDDNHLMDDDYQRQQQHQNWQHDAADQQYFSAADAAEQRGSAAYKSPQLYSPLSPTFRQRQQLDSKQQRQAYYNSSSRFSLYHPSSEGIQSSLAPTSEQLRRILGYKPSSASKKPVHLHPQWAYSRPFIHLQAAGTATNSNSNYRHRSSTSPPLDDEHDGGGANSENGELLPDSTGPRYWPFNRLQDTQAIRAVDFHPSGQVYAIGSNSRALRICAYPAEHELLNFNPIHSSGGGGGEGNEEEEVGGQKSKLPNIKSPRVLFKFLQVHRGSIYCVSFNPSGQLLATGSNDQTIHLVKYNSITHNPDGDEFRLTMHNGTVRDLCFIDDSFGSSSSLLLSAGGGDNKIYVTDCDTVTPYQSMAGHTQMVMAVNHCGGAQFVSGSYDKTIRFWDLRTRTCTSIVSAPHAGGGSGAGAPISSLRVDPSGRLLASGHTDSTCMLYDIRGAKIIQTFRPHDDEIRAISFSPKSYYLLTGSYDGRLVVSDLQGDLTRPLPSSCVAECYDKIVQAKWHPNDFTFVSTSADKSATLWALPGEYVQFN